MNFLDWISQFRELTFLGIAAAPIAGLFFLSKEQFHWSTPKGFFIQLKLFMKGGQGASAGQASSSVSHLGSDVSYKIVKVSDESSSSPGATVESASSQPSSSQDKTLSLVLELPLKNLWNWSYYRYCLPEKSLLKRKQKEAQVQSSTVAATESSNSDSCELKWYEGYRANEEAKENVISLLFNLFTKWLYLQHAVNMKYLSELDAPQSPGTQASGGSISTSSEATFTLTSEASSTQASSGNGQVDKSQLKKACDLAQAPQSSETDSKLFKTLLLSSDTYRKCYLPPHTIELTLETGEASKPEAIKSAASSPAVTENDVNVERIKKGTLNGQIYYALFDYWGKTKPLENETSSEPKNTFIYLKRPNPITYTLEDLDKNTQGPGSPQSQPESSPPKVSLAQMYEKLQSQEIDLEKFGHKRQAPK
ncbi:hypothetical protein MHLP_03175 [Candidatus Mycoplasma haematolamae str. Purdue]|uniref:Uncharacterized protein n=1 Tax=Mycoplasma haematolamae (strain Purdue) TaxID=1212765 RepID=I7BA95_MYCHA|nr:hypothetical protein [Candidatus Mycoplasma haematolamae]AFO52215.1 hypothetical protein MHLP_03175 [Candidatus Mycoplasma haematolamae str. Purdue]